MESTLVDNILGALMHFMFPIKMLLRLYSLCILMVDMMWVVVNAIYAVLQAVYECFKPPPLKSVRLETALVIGSGRGVGREIAIQLSELGAIVLCVDKNKANNDNTVEIIKRKGGSAAGFVCDITKQENVKRLALEVKKDLGFATMIFYCCGIPSPRSLLTQPPQDIHDTLNLTLTAYFWLLDYFMPDMKAKNHGHIVALTSVAGISYIKNQMPLSVAQFAVQGFAESLMEDLRINKVDGVHVTLTHIYPFIVEESSDLKPKIPSYFGTITPALAASSILDSVRRNYPEASVPKHLLYLGHLLRVLPRKATVLIRDLLDTGVDFA
ncbi:epidermal retinol dehydrogenase 2-like [Plodia interpunctella]|uniref:epidermal retinol dehydrogenase 2-like n=1 Tax=Plodia interpunctella TaxID=58824 RepID=UPI002367DDFF|nr:epidermal retinol dehydrogenase 2-like [Plodia interpunctella]XP_053616802.1 epidermal retinol dehydrogenase 2-like [Plodia interpunctella]XP_053616808.1 epidermal retinol dehydrogenase 2-like [Plodia interpunctella]XP_053616812.1 epidermal retinol dehydrogenase 2-like [Plodia interpunctella]XP_053616820.1 epidermal retinol dehydrogenase 2-like [Plodia interpunctella]XP_053616822.1 epidermal retinol dehydrogenase 2-like [Plodia interpunctella]